MTSGFARALLAALPAVFVCAVAGPPARAAGLDLERRVAAERAIAQVTWEHMLWPADNPGAKPALAAVLPDAVLRERVRDGLAKSVALERVWGHPLTGPELNAELQRMARESRRPEVLRELFDALGNDPVLITECLVRPRLADRLLRGFVAHGLVNPAGQDADAWWQAHRREFLDQQPAPAVGGASRTPDITAAACTEDAWTSVRTDSPEGRDGFVSAWTGSEFLVWGGVFDLALRGTGYRYDPVTDTWRSMSTAGAPSPRRDATGVWTGSRFVVHGGSDANGPTDSGTLYDPLTDTWSLMTPQWTSSVAVWTGSLVLYPGLPSWRYDPATNMWTQATCSWGAHDSTFTWTGTELMAWGGWFPGANGERHAVGGGFAYSPTIDSCRELSTSGEPSARWGATGVWTGQDVIVWGGMAYTNTGARWNPATNTWTALPVTPATPGVRWRHSAVWTGAEMIVWGGESLNGIAWLDDGARFDPVTNAWTPVAHGAGTPLRRSKHTAAWTGTEMIVWGGVSDLDPLPAVGGRYNPATDAWRATAAYDAPAGRYDAAAVWTGAEMIVVGGAQPAAPGRYDPATDDWHPTAAVDANVLQNASAVWTGNEVLTWAGHEGRRYAPLTDTWATLPSAGAPDGDRSHHSAVWTGTQMIVWGGLATSGYSNTGARFDVASGAWYPMNDSGAPGGRSRHSAVWTGSEMIVYGGETNSGLDDGGRYRPSTDTWLPIGGGAGARRDHTAVWTGSEMIVWGGVSSSSYLLDWGARYTPSSDSWIVTSSAHAKRSRHVAVWTGDAMIVWGGLAGAADSGERYDPRTDTWTVDGAAGAPRSTDYAVGVFTGDGDHRLITWGGQQYPTPFASGGLYCRCVTYAWYRDVDGDGYGDAATLQASCNAPGPGWIRTAGDCADNNAAVHPGALELCNAIDDDCDGTVDNDVDGAPYPAHALALGPAKTQVSWPAQSAAKNYDLVRGDVATLRAAHGNFTASMQACVRNDTTLTTALDTFLPTAGNGAYYLYRMRTCGNAIGTYNDPGNGQYANRDPGINASAKACP